MNSIYQKIIENLSANPPKTEKELLGQIRKIAGKGKIPPPKKADLLKEYHKMVKKGIISQSPSLELQLKKRAIRTLSGVAPITVMTAPLSCPSRCLYCPNEKNMPKSYLSNQPAAMRAVLNDFDPFRQTQTRIQALQQNGHPTDKLEIIINGGTWSAHPKRYQTWYILRIFQAANYFEHNEESPTFFDFKKSKELIREKLSAPRKLEPSLYGADDNDLMKQLFKEQEINETNQNRIIGITLETRPDAITPGEVQRMRLLGATKVELGVQTLDQEIMDLNRRNQTREQVIEATRLLKDAGFKVAYHMMPNLYGSNPEKDIAMFRELFKNPSFQPDFLKIYPCVVVENADLHKNYQKGDYIPYNNKTLAQTLIEIKKNIPITVRVARLARDIPRESITAGCDISNIRELIHKQMKDQGLSCRCIRCREPKGQSVDLQNLKLFTQAFEASGAREFFLSFESQDRKTLYAFLRLRLPGTQTKMEEKIPEIKNAAMVRELHTYGKMQKIDKRVEKNSVQHLGLGKQLMLKAEKIARQQSVSKMAVISGIGTRKYYEKLGYELKGTYMLKKL